MNTRIDQTFLNPKFIAYCKHKGIIIPVVPESEKAQEQIEIILAGLCVGYSIFYSALAAIGEEKLAKQMLEAASQWDESKESLSQFVYLSEASTPHTMDQIFERVFLNNIAIYQHNLSSILNVNIFSTQHNILTVGSFFEVVTRQGEKKKVEDRVASFLACSEDELGKILDHINSQDMMILLHTTQHTCSIRKDQATGKFCFYDSNEENGEKCFEDKAKFISHVRTVIISKYLDHIINEFVPNEPIYLYIDNQVISIFLDERGYVFSDEFSDIGELIFTSKEDLFVHLKIICQHYYTSGRDINISIPINVSIEISSLNGNLNLDLVQNCHAFSEKASLTSLDSSGLRLLAKHQPNFIFRVLREINRDFTAYLNFIRLIKEEDSKLLSGLDWLIIFSPGPILQLIKSAQFNTELLEIITDRVLFFNESDYLGFELFSEDSQSALLLLLRLWSQSEETMKKLSLALAFKKQGMTNFYYIGNQAPDAFLELFNLAENNEGLAESIFIGLLEKKEADFNCFSLFLGKYTWIASRLFRLVNGNMKLSTLLSKLLSQQFDGGFSGFSNIAYFTPDAVPELLSLAKTNPVILEGIALALRSKDDTHRSNLHFLVQYRPHLVPSLFELLHSHPQFISCLEESLEKKDDSGATFLSDLLEKTPSVFLELLRLTKYYPRLLMKFTFALSLKNVKGETGMHAILKCLPSEISQQFILFANHNPAMLMGVALTLTDKNSDGTTTFNLMALLQFDALLLFFQQIMSKPQLLEVIAPTISAQDGEGNTGLYFLILCGVNRLQLMATLLANEHIKQHFILALLTEHKNGSSGLSLVVNLATELLPALLPLIKDDVRLQDKLADIFVEINEQSSMLCRFLSEGPRHFFDLLKMVTETTNTKLQISFAIALAQNLDNSWTPLHVIITEYPDYLLPIFKVAGKNEVILRGICNVLSNKLNLPFSSLDGKTGYEVLSIFAPEMAAYLENMIATSQKWHDQTRKLALIGKNKRRMPLEKPSPKNDELNKNKPKKKCKFSIKRVSGTTMFNPFTDEEDKQKSETGESLPQHRQTLG